MGENINIDGEKKGIFRRFLLKLNGIYRSLRVRIFFALVVIGILPVFVICGFMKYYVEQEFLKSKEDRLLSQAHIMADNIALGKYGGNIDNDETDSDIAQLSASYNGRIIIIDNNFVIKKDSYSLDNNKTVVSEDVFKAYDGENIVNYDEEMGNIEILLPIIDSNKNKKGVLYVIFSTEDIEYSLKNIEKKADILQDIAVLTVLIASFVIAYLFVRPIKKGIEKFHKINNGYLDTRLNINTYKETEDLSTSFNDMIDTMQKLDASRQEFVSNVSHELKTPITSIKVLADSLLMQDNIPNEIYREFFADIAKEVDRENEIIMDLLELVRSDKKNAKINISKVNINEMLELILKRIKPIAAKKNVEITLESFRPIEAEVDEVKLTSAFSNLVENAVKYNVEDGWVRVNINSDHQFFYVKVADSGIGIPEESCNMVFERFYRVDKDRARKTGGTGLGLAITRNVILLHNGDIKVHSIEGEGTTFTVRIPLTYTEDKKTQKDEIKKAQKSQMKRIHKPRVKGLNKADKETSDEENNNEEE